MVASNVSDTSHIRSQLVYFINSVTRFHAILKFSQIENQELVCIDIRKLGIFQIYTSHPIPLTPEIGGQVMTDKSPCTRD